MGRLRFGVPGLRRGVLVSGAPGTGRVRGPNPPRVRVLDPPRVSGWPTVCAGGKRGGGIASRDRPRARREHRAGPVGPARRLPAGRCPRIPALSWLRDRYPAGGSLGRAPVPRWRTLPWVRTTEPGRGGGSSLAEDHPRLPTHATPGPCRRPDPSHGGWYGAVEYISLV